MPTTEYVTRHVRGQGAEVLSSQSSEKKKDCKEGTEWSSGDRGLFGESVAQLNPPETVYKC